MTLVAPLVLPTAAGVQVQVVVGAAGESGRRAVSVYSRGAGDAEWVLHAEGVLGVEPVDRQPDSGFVGVAAGGGGGGRCDRRL